MFINQYRKQVFGLSHFLTRCHIKTYAGVMSIMVLLEPYFLPSYIKQESLFL